MHKAETSFWQEVAATANPDWDIRLGPAIGSDMRGLASMNVYTYSVHVASGWSFAGALGETEFNRLIEVTASSSLPLSAIKDSCAAAIKRCMKLKMGAHSAEGTELLGMTIMSLAGTRTLDLVRERYKSVAGHWITIFYETKSGAMLTRPAFYPQHGQSLMSPDDLNQMVRTIIMTDMHPAGTAIQATLKSCGGAEVCEMFR